MTDMMAFPDTWEEFEKSYGFVDDEEAYTNGSRLIPSFRVKQWLDHIAHMENERQATNSSDCISRQAAIEALHMHLMYRMGTDSNKKRLDDWINSLPSAQGKPFNLPEIYIAEGYDTIEGEDGNVGFGVYVPDENQIYVAGDVEGEIRARALFHEVCHWVQAMCGRSFDEDEANEFSDIVYDALPSAQPERTCVNCGRTANNGGWYADGGTRCPIEELYALPKDGYCHLWEKRNVTDDDYPERRTDDKINKGSSC